MVQAKSILFDKCLLRGDEVLQLLVRDVVNEGFDGRFVFRHGGEMLPMR